MSSAWQVYVDATFPVPLLMLVLMLAPLPRSWRHPIAKFVHTVLSVRILQAFTLGQVMLLVTTTSLAATTRATLTLVEAPTDASPNQRTGFLARKWRTERNFWIALYSFTLWIVLLRVHRLIERADAAEEEVRKLQPEEVDPQQKKDD
eukprot:jgi/Pico_ML_1/52860/g3504.t1